MNLHQNKALFTDAVLAASQRFGVPQIYVEKDYWVTLVLYEIFHSHLADQIVFKGGTCLSKCHQLIQRFSEDIDLVVIQNEKESDNQLKKKIRSISKIVGDVLPETYVEGLTAKRGNFRKTAHQYTRLFDGNFGQAREQLVLEATWLGNYEPFTIETVFKSDGFSKMLQKVGKDDFISYKNNNAWLKEHPCHAIIFKEAEKTWDRLKNTYRTIFKDMVIGKLPDESNLINTLKKIEERMRSIGWQV